MRTRSLAAFVTCLLLLMSSFGLRAQTGTEPTVQQIYATANGGDLRKANEMIDQVIAHHPNSGKAHYVKAELAARGKDAATAKAELQKAQQLAPGLAFAKPEAVSALRKEVDGLSNVPAAPPATRRNADVRSMGGQPADSTPRASGGGFSLGSLLLPAIVVIGLFMFLRRRRAQAPAPAAPFTPGPNDFGRYPQPPDYPPQGPGPGMYPAGYPPREGMGSSIARGVGTGLAIGAGAAIASEIGRRMFDHNGNEVHPGHDPAGGSNANSQLARDAGLGGWNGDASPNQDMGGQDFGIQDGGGWDDAGGGAAGGGNDWDT